MKKTFRISSFILLIMLSIGLLNPVFQNYKKELKRTAYEKAIT